jgi:endonuclease/exonuclease/phosphatase family metal-dependent hydrolase
MSEKIRLILFTLSLALLFQDVSGQHNKSDDPRPTTNDQRPFFRLAFYNIENLFDTKDDPHINDNGFLPGARIPWTTERYELKLDHLARVIGDLSDEQAVAVFGLCEVENKAVLEDLVATPSIRPYNYQVIHHDSPDERGIDNAMLYDAAQFQPISVYGIPVTFPDHPKDCTRDILYVKGVSKKSKTDTLHIFVNHWPSRSEGQEISEPKRIRAAEIQKRATDSLFAKNPLALIVIMGDLNDEPADKSIVKELNALPPTQKPTGNKLYNLMEPLYHDGKGTLYYNDWDLFDQVIISGNFWNKSKGLIYPGTVGNIYSADYLLFTNKQGISRPNRTAGKEYYGGYSDHLPVYIDLFIER